MDGQEPVRVHFLPQAIEEDGEVMEVVQLAWLYRKLNSVHGALVVHLHGQVAPVVVPPELGGLDLPLGIGAGLLPAGLPHDLPLVAVHGITTGALATQHEVIYGGGGL